MENKARTIPQGILDGLLSIYTSDPQHILLTLTAKATAIIKVHSKTTGLTVRLQWRNNTFYFTVSVAKCCQGQILYEPGNAPFLCEGTVRPATLHTFIYSLLQVVKDESKQSVMELAEHPNLSALIETSTLTYLLEEEADCERYLRTFDEKGKDVHSSGDIIGILRRDVA